MYFLINQKKIILLWAVLVVVLSYAFDKADAQIAGYDITINQLHLLNYADSVYFSPIALISLGYWPDVDDYYVNITALDASQQPQWVVRNLYLPDLTWIDTPQTIAARFTMEMLGVAAGEEVTSLEIAIVTSEGVLDQMPVGGQFY